MFLQIISKMVENMHFFHNEFLTKQHFRMLDFSTLIGNRLITQDGELINWNNKSVKELRASQQQIDEFFNKVLCCDIETGSFYLSL